MRGRFAGDADGTPSPRFARDVRTLMKFRGDSLIVPPPPLPFLTKNEAVTHMEISVTDAHMCVCREPRVWFREISILRDPPAVAADNKEHDGICTSKRKRRKQRALYTYICVCILYIYIYI